MYELPDEIWSYIKEFVFNWKRSHKLKMESAFKHLINGMFKERYERWTHFPPWSNTNDIIRDEYPGPVASWQIGRPLPNLPLTSITWNVEGSGGWWCGYGWQKCHAERKLYRL